MSKSGVKLSAFTSSSEFKKLNSPAQRSGMDVKIISQKGFPFIAKRHKWRFGAVLGCFMMVVFIWSMSLFIWEVEIVPDGDVKIEGFTEYIEEIGVKVGAKKSSVNIPEVQEKLLDSFSQLSWVSLNIFGTKAQIEYTYAKPQKPIADSKSFTNVVASKDGEITHVEGYRGVNTVKVGANVPKGSLLISGVVQNEDMTERFVHAQGKVFARTVNTFSCESLFSQKSEIIIDSESVYTLYFFGVKIPFGKSQLKASIAQTELFLEGNGTVLPVGLLRTDYNGIQEKNCQFTNNQARLLSLLQCVRHKREDYAEAELEKVKFNLVSDKEKSTVTMDITCVEDIAVEVSSFTEKN